MLTRPNRREATSGPIRPVRTFVSVTVSDTSPRPTPRSSETDSKKMPAQLMLMPIAAIARPLQAATISQW